LANGEEIVVDSQGYGRARNSENRDDRKLALHLQTQVALAKARNYDSVLERELFQDNLPPAVYRTLVSEVNKALPTLHRYFKLRARMLGVDQLHYYDIYPPLVSLDREFNLEDSKKITLEATEILGTTAGCTSIRNVANVPVLTCPALRTTSTPTCS
jgi:oligoendopeptidase F